MKKKYPVIIAILFLSVLGASAQTYELEPEWSDEFDGTELDLTKWSYQLGTGQTEGLTDWGNNEKQYYRAENVSLREGMLIFTAKREAFGGKNYTSARITTRGPRDSNPGLYNTTFGRIEARISLPPIEGMWPAFWMLPQASPYGGWASSGEIDIMEVKGRLSDRYAGTIHYGGGWPNNTYSSIGDKFYAAGTGNCESFHNYAIKWSATKIEWFLDGVAVGNKTNWYSSAAAMPAPFDVPFYLLLNLAIGGNFDGNREPPAAFQEAEMKIDWVRVYRLAGEEPPLPNNENLARNKPATASSEFNHGEYGLLRAGNATDGNPGTRWGSYEENVEYTPEWLQVDLEKEETLSKIVINWEAAFAREYNVEVSIDNDAWTPVFSTVNGAEGTVNIPLDNVPARYIKVNCTRKTSPWAGNFYGYSILELEAYGSSQTGLNTVSPVDFNVDLTGETIAVRPADNVRSLTLYSVSGQLIARSATDKIAAGNLNKGVYLLNVSDVSGHRKTFKVILRK
jgi:beta-glucanase (GH16 family)